jgi:hypothetical protein
VAPGSIAWYSVADGSSALSIVAPRRKNSAHLHRPWRAATLGLNRTDLKCVGVIAQRGCIAVGEIGKAAGLTRGP